MKWIACFTGLLLASATHSLAEDDFSRFFPRDSLFCISIPDAGNVLKKWGAIKQREHLPAAQAHLFEQWVLQANLPIPTNVQSFYTGAVSLGISDTTAFLDAISQSEQGSWLSMPAEALNQLVFIADLKGHRAAFHRAQIDAINQRIRDETDSAHPGVLTETNMEDVRAYVYSRVDSNAVDQVIEAWAYVGDIEVASPDLVQLARTIRRVKEGVPPDQRITANPAYVFPPDQDARLYLDLPRIGNALSTYWREGDTLMALTGISSERAAKVLELEALHPLCISARLRSDTREAVIQSTSGFTRETALGKLLQPAANQPLEPPSFISPEALRYTIQHLPLQATWQTVEKLLTDIGPQAENIKKFVLPRVEKEAGIQLTEPVLAALGQQVLHLDLADPDRPTTPRRIKAFHIQNWKVVEQALLGSRLNAGAAPRKVKLKGTDALYYTFQQSTKTLAYAYRAPFLIVSLDGAEALEDVLRCALNKQGLQEPLHTLRAIPGDATLLRVERDRQPDLQDEWAFSFPVEDDPEVSPFEIVQERLSHTSKHGEVLTTITTLRFSNEPLPRFRSTEKAK